MKQFMKKNQVITNRNIKTNGITLIALIITIIVLLILSGVILNLTIGERGIFKVTKESKINHIMAEMREELALALSDLQLEKQGKATLDDVTQQWADNNKLKEYDAVIENEDEEKSAIMKKDGITGKFIIDEKLNIIDGEQITENGQYQVISLNLAEGINIDNQKQKIALHKTYKAKITTEEEYVLETLTVTMGGENIAVNIEDRRN